MKWWAILLIVLGLILISGAVFAWFYTNKIAKKVYRAQLVRETPSKWPRECTALDNEEQVRMWNLGLEWSKRHQDVCKEVHVNNNGLNLYGEYYDFGFDKTVFIICGRPECLIYSYFYALAYEGKKYNILVIDNRAVGKSDGLVNTCGIFESDDDLAWIKMLKEDYHQKKIILHCICVGGAGAFIAYKKDNSAFDALIVDGLFINFKETFKNHMIDLNRPVFPVFYEMWRYFKKDTGVSINLSNPLNDAKYVTCPILFIYTDKDIFSKPDKSKLIFASCASKEKHIKWFHKGLHSHVRINNMEEYDKTCEDFLNKYVG